MEYPKFKVTVSCMTYNQSKYITDAMNGFTMQQTSFPFVCTIVDDASTDGEQEVAGAIVYHSLCRITKLEEYGEMMKIVKPMFTKIKNCI